MITVVSSQARNFEHVLNPPDCGVVSFLLFDMMIFFLFFHNFLSRPRPFGPISVGVWRSVHACKCMFFPEHQCEWTRLGEDEDRPSAVSSAGLRSRRLPLYPRFPGCRWSFRTPQKWHLHAASAPNTGTIAGRLAAHVLEAHRNQVRLQVCEHHRLLPDLRGGYHWQLDAAQDHIQEQVHEERTQCPDWQPGSGRPAVYYHCHPNQCV